MHSTRFKSRHFYVSVKVYEIQRVLCYVINQSLELKLLAFLSGTLHILLFISAYCANK